MSTTVQRESFDTFGPLREAVNRFMEGGVGGPERAMFMLGRSFPVDILETPEEYVIEASLFGIRPENVQITTTGNTLTIRAGQKAARQSTQGTYLRRERIEAFMPDVGRTITLPGHINPEKVNAEYEHGVLTIHVGKDEEVIDHKIPLHVREVAKTK
ncbi:MAG: Hsp20/alpha crystallin family protein [Ktedonobacterales bacterium]